MIVPKASEVRNRELMRGVEAPNIEGRIRLGRSRVFCASLRHSSKDTLFLFHPGQDVIARSIKDAIDPLDGIPGKTLAQRLDNGNAASDRAPRRRAQTPFSSARRASWNPCLASSALFAGHAGFAGVERGLGGGERWAIRPADQLHKKIDPVGPRQRNRVVEPGDALKIDSSLFRRIPP